MIFVAKRLGVPDVRAHVRHDRDKASLGKIQARENFLSVRMRSLHARGIESVVNRPYFPRGHAFVDELASHFVAVRNHRVSQTVCATLNNSLLRWPHRRLAPR